MKDPRYRYDSYGFSHRRDATDYVVFGLVALASPFWGPFWLVGRLTVWAAGVAYDTATTHKETRR